jgi:transposase-like protein
MPESGPFGFVRGVLSNERPYRDPNRNVTYGGDQEMRWVDSQDFKERAVARLLPPESAPITLVSQEQGVSVATLERWRADALSRGAPPDLEKAARLQR